MLSVITNPVGIDVQIRKMQEFIHARLMDTWNLDQNVAAENKLYECYSRCYRNKKDNGYVAEVYKGANQYKEVYWNDKLNAISFFGMDGSIDQTKSGYQETDVHLVFFVNLKKLKPDSTNRADEEVRVDILNILSFPEFGFKFTGIALGLENVLKEYPGSYRDQRLKAVDMHPIHCFRLNFQLQYNYNNCY